jgi:hypothetical protein
MEAVEHRQPLPSSDDEVRRLYHSVRSIAGEEELALEVLALLAASERAKVCQAAIAAR